MPRLSKQDRQQALILLASGTSVNNVALQFNCHRNTISRLQTRFQQTGDISDRPRSGRPRVTTARQDRYITLTHLRQRFKTASSTVIQYGVHKQTILNRLRANRRPIRPRRPYVGQILTRRNRNLRLRWARQHRHGRVHNGHACCLVTNLDSV